MRTVVFIDGQNLYRLAKNAWGKYGHPYHFPCYDVMKVAQALTNRIEGRRLSEVRFYTGVPTPLQSELWARFWRKKIYAMELQGIQVYEGRISGGSQEKGVDVSIATDLLWYTYRNLLDTAIIVSQDSDLAPAVRIAKDFARDQGRWVNFESAYPDPLTARNKPRRGIDGTQWVVIDKAMYDSCLDPIDYR